MSNPYNLSWTDRAQRRGAGAVFLRPPADLCGSSLWHLVMTSTGPRRLKWRPGIERWEDARGDTVPSEQAGALGWSYIGAAPPLEVAR